MPLQHLAGGVLGVGDQAQLKTGHILLLPLAGEGHRPGGPAQEHGKHPGGHGVQGAGVAHPLFVKDAPQLGAHVHRRPAGGLVND